MNEQEKVNPIQPANEPKLESPVMRSTNGIMAAISNNQLTKIIMIGFLAMLLQIPISMISSTVRERQVRSHQAMEEVASKWGREQQLIGPIITVPYEIEVTQKEVTQYNDTTLGKSKTVTVVEYANFLPEELKIDAKTENLLRHRGIFEIPVYRMNLTMNGQFTKPDFSEFKVQPTKILWDQARLILLITDPRAITNQAAITWNNEKLAFEPGGKETNSMGRGIQISLKEKLTADSSTFSCKLTIQGSTGVFFAPLGRTTEAALESNWSDPSFQGNWLPTEQSTDQNGFRATWQISSLGRNFSQSWVDTDTSKSPVACMDTFGVKFIQPVDTYSMAQRSIKYQLLFLALTFITLWLFEVLAKVRLHALQYLLIGAGMCLFYLLELSLAEQLGFFLAYLLAASSVILLVSCYCIAILKSPKRSAIVGAFISLLYGYLYTLLINQDYALLAGSIGLFLLLGTVMYLTRKIDWNSFSNKQALRE
ncbi:MAG: cell envelope integrity protein CreD [Desulfocapsaceae bacterium]|nr:cell envelope integrity protein CreD [Desulfocapsaceae bacterium]